MNEYCVKNKGPPVPDAHIKLDAVVTVAVDDSDLLA